MITYYIIKCVCVCPGPGLCPCQLCSDGDRVVATGALEALMFNGGPMKSSVKWIYCNTYCRYHMYINIYIVYIITTPLRLLFRGEPYQNVRYIFCNPP